MTSLRTRPLSSALLLAATCWWLASAAAAHAQFPNIARGDSPSGMFDVGGIDVVNGFNGNLVIKIPIGHAYPVGGTMGSYAFTLVYNSKAWDFIGQAAPQCTGDLAATDTLAVASPQDNAGLGWRFSLGRLGGDFPIAFIPPPPSPLAYHGMDGSDHYLFNQLASGPGATVQQPGMQFSNDGSYLRYSPAASAIELPDGNVQTFNSDGYPTRLEDPFGNGLTITYTTDPSTCPGNVWLIGDGFRTHKVCFRPTGLASPEQTEVVDHIDLAAFGTNPANPALGNVATYRFLYNTDVNGQGFQDLQLTGTGTEVRGCHEPPWQPHVYLLTKLLLPDGTSYSMGVAGYSQSFPGELTNLSLPTSGSIAWQYQFRSLPQPHTDDESLWYVPIMSSVVGVSQRSLYDNSGQLIGTWKYQPAALPPIANEIVNEVDFPSPDPAQAAQGITGHRILTYYSACVYGICQNEAGATDPPDTYAVDYGLPLSRRRPDGTGRYLSQEIYAAGASTPLRQIYVNYDNDGPNPAPGSAASPIFANQRPQAQRTVYLDDPLPGQPGNYGAVATASSGYDGLGHYRIASVSDNLGFNTARTETTDWNPFGMPGPAAPWVLDTYDFKEQQEGAALNRQEAHFDPATGFLLCERRLQNGRNRGAGDVVVTHTPDQAGQVAAEGWFGGDTQPVSVAPGCASLPATPIYAPSHLYSAGVRSSTTVQVTVNGSPTTLKLLDQDIDAGSGRVGTARDPAGRPTTYTYEAMGRPVTSTPRGDATTVMSYGLSDTAPPVINRALGSPALESESWLLDSLGRTAQHTVAMPGNASSSTVTTFNALGWKVFESEPASSPGTKGTTYQNYDPFGRPALTVAADGNPTYFTYHGVRAVIRSQRVWDGTRQLPVNTTEEYDGLGRLRQVREPDGTSMRYAYDPGGRLAMATSFDGAGHFQMRTFHYDGRGFLTRAVQPEDGVTTYQYDARGHATRKATPTGTVFSSYDEAGRLVAVSSPQAQLRQFSYGTGAGAGKLVESRAFNWRLASTCTDFEVRQDFSYDAATGRLATTDTSLWQGGALEHWTQSYAYDGAGRITSVAYPNCVALCASPSRQVATAYAFGRPTSVSGFASAITYNGNGTLATIHHANGVVFTETPDLSGMARPGSLRADSSTGQPWPREDYFYDGTGNIKAIGGKTFAYDVTSRIVTATVPTAGAQPYQAYAYDGFSNLATIYRGSGPGDATYISYTADPGTNQLIGATYDPSGELLSYQGSGYTWDVLGQATSVSTGSEAWTHTYDATGERVWSWRTSPSRLDTYALRGADQKLLSLFTKTGPTYTWEDYAYREAMLLGAALSDGTVHHFDVDHLGSVRLETTAAGAQPTYRDFWPYGDEATPPGGSERMKFAGQERDLGNLTSIADDIDYMHARYFRPIFGRFLSADPAAGSAKESRRWNRYSYVAGNPLRFTDPTGQYLCSDKAGCADFDAARLATLQSTRATAEERAAAAAFGELGEPNGVTVRSGDPGKGNAAGTLNSPVFGVEGDKAVVKSVKSETVVRPGLSKNEEQAVVVHEGSHILDARARAASWNPLTERFERAISYAESEVPSEGVEMQKAV